MPDAVDRPFKTTFTPCLVDDLGVVEPDSGCGWGYSFVKAVTIDGRATPPRRLFFVETEGEEAAAGEAFDAIMAVCEVSSPSTSYLRPPAPVMIPAGGLRICSNPLALDGCYSSDVDDSRGVSRTDFEGASSAANELFGCIDSELLDRAGADDEVT